MIDLKRVRAVALDIAGAGESYDRQDDLSDFIWHLLERHYRMYVFSSNPEEDLSEEDFGHPKLAILREEMPPSQATLAAHPQLATPETLWITDAEGLQEWIRAAGAPFMYLRYRDADIPGAQHLPRLSELSALLHPTALLMRDLAASVADLRRFKPEGALLVGAGGPPKSGYQGFAVDLRTHLHESGHELVELLDLSTLMRSTETLLEQGGAPGTPWVSDAVGHWVREAVLAPLRAGEAVYVERPPPELPRDFSPHFPLYLSTESVVLLLGELLFTLEVADALDLSILLEVSPDETTRRLYEMPAGERFDSKFTAQYLSREGRIYADYLARNRVRARATLHVDANDEEAFFLIERPATPLV